MPTLPPPTAESRSAKRVLAVASAGGHWIQLLRLRPAFNQHDVVYVTTSAGHDAEVDGQVMTVVDASSWNKFALAKMFGQMTVIMLRVRPQVVISTGAAPGFAAIVLGKLLGATTVWIDSIANSEMLSSSGERARRWADLHLTQWEHLAAPEGPQYWGRVL